MDEKKVQRRLAAILAADVAGYSRLMGSDEEGTLRRLQAHRRELIDPKIDEHRGRIVKTTGDGLLAEFASVVESIRCAVEVQRAMVERNIGVPVEMRIDLRIGVHVGDVMIDDDDIYGDGVNVAARLESIAAPGGICVSERVYEDATGRIDCEFDDIGEHRLKNIGRSVRVYRIHFAATKPVTPLSTIETAPRRMPAITPGLPEIGYLGVAPRPVVDEFRRGLAAYGLADPEIIRVHYRWSEGNSARNPDLLRELIEIPVKVIVAEATPQVIAAKQITNTIPIVMVGVGDPVGYGIVPSLMRPGGNITGLSGGLYEYLPRTLRLSKEILPNATRLAILTPTGSQNPGAGPDVKTLEDIAHKLDMIPRVYSGSSLDEIRVALTAMDRRTDLLLVIPDQGLAMNRAVILDHAAAIGVPVVCPWPEYVAGGALMSLGPNRNEVYRRIAYFVDAILKGAAPSDLPIEEPRKDLLMINVRTARALNIKIPTPILMSAQELIE